MKIQEHAQRSRRETYQVQCSLMFLSEHLTINSLGTSFIGGCIQTMVFFCITLPLNCFYNDKSLHVTRESLQQPVPNVASWLKIDLHLNAGGDLSAPQTSHSLCWSMICGWIQATGELCRRYPKDNIVCNRCEKGHDNTCTSWSKITRTGSGRI